MDYSFADRHLEELYLAGTGSNQYPPAVVDAFIRRVRAIEDALDERDLRSLKSLHFEKLKGKRNRYSMRLNKAWRLILTFEQSRTGKVVVLIEINRHYGD